MLCVPQFFQHPPQHSRQFHKNSLPSSIQPALPTIPLQARRSTKATATLSQRPKLSPSRYSLYPPSYGPSEKRQRERKRTLRPCGTKDNRGKNWSMCWVTKGVHSRKASFGGCGRHQEAAVITASGMQRRPMRGMLRSWLSGEHRTWACSQEQGMSSEWITCVRHGHLTVSCTGKLVASTFLCPDANICLQVQSRLCLA